MSKFQSFLNKIRHKPTQAQANKGSVLHELKRPSGTIKEYMHSDFGAAWRDLDRLETLSRRS